MNAARARAAAVAVAALVSGAPLDAQSAPVSPQALDRFEELSQAFRTVYEHVAPAVVLIRTSFDLQQVQSRLPRLHPPLDPEDGGEFSGLGSGIIVSEDGYLLSNHHVIRGADSIQVSLLDRRRFPARIVGVDSLIDIALLKIDASGLTAAPLGRSEELQIGDWVLAIGYPLGMGTTLTHGIVSALGRQADVIQADYRIESFIQTNAVINPGNSGGPLLDLRGRVVGVNTAISTKTGYFIGYGLAVPIDLAREAMDDFFRHGRVVRGYLGIGMEEVEANLVRTRNLDLQPPRGVYIDSIYAGTPADRSGLAVGDVVLAVNGHRVNEPNEVQTLIYGKDPGEVVELTVFRDGRERLEVVVLGERDEDQLLARGRQRVSELGLTVAGMEAARARALGFTDEVARALGLSHGDGAVVVIAIDPAGPAAAKGIQVDDVITEIDQTAIASVDDFVRSVSRLEAGQSALFWFWRQHGGVGVRTLRIQPLEGR